MVHRVSRAVHFPQSFPNKAFDKEGLLFFQASEPKAVDASFYALSVVCRCMMPNDGDVHNYGEGIAIKQNAGYLAREGHEPPDDKRRTYLAFYDVAYDRLAEVQLDFYELAVRAVPEDGVWAHLEIHFVRNSTVSDSPKRRRADRGAAISLIADRLSGPVLLPVDDSDADLLARQAELPVFQS